MAPFARNVKPVAQTIVTINCNTPTSKPNLICIRPPTFGSIGIGPLGAKRFAYRVDCDDANFPDICKSGEPGDVTNKLGLSRRSYESIRIENKLLIIHLFYPFLLIENLLSK